MSKLNESLIIQIFQKKLVGKKFVSEDVETLNFGNQKIFVKTDTLVQSTDIPPKMSLKAAARKSIIACISDFAAKGVKPEYGIISVNLPCTISQKQLVNIAKGFKEASLEFGLSILGGDTNEGKELVFNVCIFGKSKNIITRQGAKIGDLIFVTGPFGYTPIGLYNLINKTRRKEKIIAKSINYFLKPKPKLNFALKSKRYFSSSMDSSDGLSTTLNTMAKQSMKKFVIDNIPARKDIINYSKTNKQLIDLVFHGGEEYEFVFTANPKFETKINHIAKILKTPIIKIGQVTTGKGVQLEQDNRKTILKDLGWKHFT